METKTTRISKWVYELFSSKAEHTDTTFIKKLDEIAEMIHLLDVKEVELNDFLKKTYKEDENNTPILIYEVLSGLMNYYDELNRKFNKYNFGQFIDRWNIVVYYIRSHVYTNVLAKSALTDKELNIRAESTVALTFLFDKNTNEVLKCINEIMSMIDPYENSYPSKQSKALILTEIFKHEKLMEFLENENIIRKEAAIVELYGRINKKYDLISKGTCIFSNHLETTGLPNKIAYLLYQNYKQKGLKTLPYFINEEFINDIFNSLHTFAIEERSSDLYNSSSLISAYNITQVVKELNAYTQDDGYLKGNLENGNNFNKLDDALQADIDTLNQKEFTYFPEMRLRTPMLMLESTINSKIRFIQRENIKKVVLDNIINICHPIYAGIVKKDGEILHFRETLKTCQFNNKNALLSISMEEKAYYVNLVLFIPSNNSDGTEVTYTLNLKHGNLKKINYCLHLEGSNTTKIDDELSIYYNQDDTLKILLKQGSIFLHGKTKDSFIDVISDYANSDKFKENNEIDILNNGMI